MLLYGTTQHCAVTDTDKRSEQRVITQILEEEIEEGKRESWRSRSKTDTKNRTISMYKKRN